MKKFLLIFILIIPLIFVISCKSTQTAVVEEPEPAPPPPPVEEVVDEYPPVVVAEEPTPDTNRNELIFPAGISIRETERGKILVVDTRAIYDFASTNMPANVPVSFGQVIEFMNMNENVTIIIEGHTSNMGIAYPYNYNLSVERARNAKIYLVNSGIAENRLMESPLGESLPEYPNQDDLRRNEFVVITSDEDLQVYSDFVLGLDMRKETTYMGN
ncbi:OmpA family protein [Brachyspira catarrhinii]|uniref:OmpA family protein n=1 Tax=Brachyspira catarrhinii TaxID=2528966 RepID=A0ABY2TV05_9SPIR|nr:OmpA family protein [Brachyspira catarrhinii]TKZ36388.1 OmpA family protein [Brachyspira catarrhinii]